LNMLHKLGSLQTRLLVLLLVVISLVWVAAGVLTWANTRHELDELLDAHLAQSAALLVAQQTGSTEASPPEDRRTRRVDDDDDDETEAHRNAPKLSKYAPRVAFQVFHEGALTLHSSNAPEQPMSPQPRGFATVQAADGKAWRVFGARGHEGDVQVFVGEQVQSRQSILWAVLQGVLTPLLYALPALAVLGWLAVRRGLQPLRSLSQALGQRQPQATEPLQMADTPQEIAPVVQSLNALFERIGQMLETERRFTADAAHELRTPIAAIRVQAQVALGAAGDDAQRQQALLRTLEGCDRATHLVAQLLTLSRLEAAGSQSVTVVNLSSIAHRVAATLAHQALTRQQELTLDAPQPGLIAADDTLTGVLVRNLLDNALRYSPEGAKITLRVTNANGRVCLQVDDSGPGLAPADLARLGERFFRALGSAQSGSGLGWSIVRRIAAVQQAQVQVSASGLGGLCVQVDWPVAPDQKSATLSG